jgi:hypothetical protein
METYDRYGCSDIYYNKFLINGKNESQIEGFSAPPLSVDDFGARKFRNKSTIEDF